MRQILLIMIGLSISVYADFSKIGDIVIDSKTGLEWQDDTNVYDTWQGAIDYCEALNLGRKSDWRLPNINELTSLVDDTRYKPAIDTAVFQNIALNYYWSSSTYDRNESYILVVDMNDGHHYYNYRYNCYVRCVRSKIDTDNIPPEANAGVDQTVLVGRVVTLNGSGTDSDGTIVKYEWKEGNTLLSNDATFTKGDFSEGEHNLTLTVTDDKGATGTATVIIYIKNLSYGGG